MAVRLRNLKKITAHCCKCNKPCDDVRWYEYADRDEYYCVVSCHGEKKREDISARLLLLYDDIKINAFKDTLLITSDQKVSEGMED